MTTLELIGVSKSYGHGATEVHALQDIDVRVDAGTLVAVMGPSGSGKSTLLTIAGSLEDPTSGEVRVDGKPLAEMSRDARAQLRRRSIGYVFQDYNLLAGLTAAENVALPLELDGHRRARRTQRRWPSSTSSAWPIARHASPTSCPAASGDALRSPAQSSVSAAAARRRAVGRVGLGQR